MIVTEVQFQTSRYFCQSHAGLWKGQHVAIKAIDLTPDQAQGLIGREDVLSCKLPPHPNLVPIYHSQVGLSL